MSGTWMQRVAEGWLVYRLTHSPLMLGFLAFAGSAPALFVSPVAGVIADQVNRHRMVQVAQALAMAQACTLALFTLQGWITPNLLLFFALIMGTVRAIANPARQSFLVELIPVEDLTNAVALSAIFSNLARIAGPALAGFIIAGYGEGFCFLANGLSFLLTILCLQLMRFGEKEPRDSLESQWELLLEGFQYIRNSFPVRSLLLQFAAINFAVTLGFRVLLVEEAPYPRAGPGYSPPHNFMASSVDAPVQCAKTFFWRCSAWRANSHQDRTLHPNPVSRPHQGIH